MAGLPYVLPVYAIPADGVNDHLTPQIRWSIRDMQDWLAAQTGGHRLRVATHIRFVRLQEDAATLARLGVDGIRSELPDQPDVITAVYYGGRVAGSSCAYESGPVAAVFLGCSVYGIYGTTVGMMMLHEILHAFGVTHVTDCSCDLMWGGPWFPARPVLDYGHDDYYAALLASPYLI